MTRTEALNFLIDLAKREMETRRTCIHTRTDRLTYNDEMMDLNEAIAVVKPPRQRKKAA